MLVKNVQRESLILISSDFISAACYFTLFLVFLNPALPFFGFTLMVALVFTSMIVGAVQAIYFEPLYASCIETRDSKEKLAQEFACLGTFMTFGKLLGMGLGPIMFGEFHYYPLLFNAFTFIVSALFFYLGLRGLSSENFEKKKDSQQHRLNLNFCLLTNYSFLESAIASTLIYAAVLLLSLKLIALEASALQMSIYWTSATLSALISQTVTSRSSTVFKFLSKLDIKAGFLFIIPVFAPLFFENIWFIITCQIFFSFVNPIARNSARAHFYETFGDHKRCNQTTNPYAMRDLISQTILLLVGTTLSLCTEFILSASLVASLILMRWLFANGRVLYTHYRSIPATGIDSNPQD
jgi:hypothetical protein